MTELEKFDVPTQFIDNLVQRVKELEEENTNLRKVIQFTLARTLSWEDYQDASKNDLDAPPLAIKRKIKL